MLYLGLFQNLLRKRKNCIALINKVYLEWRACKIEKINYMNKIKYVANNRQNIVLCENFIYFLFFFVYYLFDRLTKKH